MRPSARFEWKCACRTIRKPEIGQLTFLDNSVQSSSGTVMLRATVPNPARHLWPGQFVNVRLVLATLPKAVLVPAAAPQDSAKGSFVYVVKEDSTAELRPVKLGQRQGELVVVEQGLQPGERVVDEWPARRDAGRQGARRYRYSRGSAGGRAIMNLSEPFIRKPVMTAVLTVSVIVFGVLSYLRLPVNDLPVVDYPVISVQANYPGASPDTVANNIATPLERQFMQINGLELVTSQSTQGHVSFTLQFALDKSIDAAATDVQTAISQASGSLPTDLPSPPTYSKTNPNDQPILYIALTSDSVTRRPALRLREHAGGAADQHPARREQRKRVWHQVGRAHQGRSLKNVGARNFDRRPHQRREERDQLHRRGTV